MKKYAPQNYEKEKLIRKLSTYLSQQSEDLTAAYVHGSFIKSEHFSDIDLAVLMRTKTEETLTFELDLENEIGKLLELPVDVRILNAAPLSFCQNVVRHGKVILDRDANFRSDFEGKVLKMYFDFSRYRRRYLAGVSNAPV